MNNRDQFAGRNVSRRAFLKTAAAAPLAAYLAACTSSPTEIRPGATRPVPTTTPAVLPPQARHIANAVPREILERVHNGYFPAMSGDIVTVPLGFNYFDGGISHSTALGYTQDIPMVWYGPGVIPGPRTVTRAVTSADQAPTLAAITGLTEFEAPDGVPMDEVIDPGAPRPKLIVTFVWDAAGTYVLGLWPDKWPNLKRLMSEGVTYTKATVGSAPSSTAPVHATMGTGAFPRRHGILDNVQRFPDGNIGDPWTPGPSSMLLPTFADYYGAALGDRVEIGTFATLNWHLGMMGTSTAFDDGKRQLAVLRERGGDEGAEGISWGLSDTQAEYYRFPDYLNDLPDITAYYGVADAADGAMDGKWRGHDIASLKGGFDTPARVPYMDRGIQEVIRREGFGHHEGTDLLFINSKLIDEVGHLFTASSPEMGDCILAQDANLPGFIEFLDRQVGKGQWVLLVTADHGHSADKDVTGAFPIKVDAVEEHMAQAFPSGDNIPVVARTRPGWSFVDFTELERGAYTLDQLAAGFRGLTEAETAGEEDRVSPDEAEKRVLMTSFPGAWLPGMIEAARHS